ncbi:uncharacterized protein FOMMEDRAFT_126226 [Fomitiporia mediterranea MF3/22]|uniref:uncharacterized protein n=1 Tax=Fomitiporia mediterranea (strain MF3/22) TaxID=694068 RepID=UPI00044084ED|nr:uncharacterized protein FOMMEDRAFT_126226 [Fomitiporia mediterranea MF3/22]EJD01361.1 hypothetical protein FOMMEDRAFT_126226 [Fomitiporia mediterranea MF3/22]
MRLSSFLTAVLPALSFVSAQYISEGWKPGEPVVKGQTGYTYQTVETGPVPPAATDTPSAQQRRVNSDVKASVKRLSSLLSLESLLESGPVQALFGRAGVNITEKLEAARAQEKIWDERIPLLTDDNYEDLVVEEKFETLEEEKDRIWFIVISLTAAQREGISKFVDEQFDLAFNLTQNAGDLPHVRWGRIDYMNVTRITTKWNVWRGPFLVVAKDRGQTLRFYRPGQIRLQGEILHEFLKVDAWEQTEPWRSPFGPGGSREFIMDYFAAALAKVYDITVMVPRWLLLVISGSVASLIVNIMHNTKSLWPSTKAKRTTQANTPQPPRSAEAASPPTNVQPQAAASGPKKRKGGKK